jgi:hypothetical protein
MSSVDRLSSEYWNHHSITDGCMPEGYRPTDWRRLLKNFPEQTEAAKNFVLNRPQGGEVITSGLVDPSTLPLGTILEIEEEALIAGRLEANHRERLMWALTLGLKNSNFDWERPKYKRDTDIGVVTHLERHRETPIRGLVTFDEDLMRRGLKMNPRSRMHLTGIPHTSVIRIGQVEHHKRFASLQADDHQVIKRVLQVTIH